MHPRLSASAKAKVAGFDGLIGRAELRREVRARDEEAKLEIRGQPRSLSGSSTNGRIRHAFR